MEIVTHEVAGRTLSFECPGKNSAGLAKTLFTKEPGTIAWIDSFQPGAVMWDIGANIGIYGLYAATAKGCMVYAFEPGSANYHGLNTNILLNQLDKRVVALPIAIDDSSKFDLFRMRNNIVGGALHVFGRDTDYNNLPFVAEWMQGAISLTIDELVSRFGVPAPNHVKIDVDSIEVGVVRGGSETFRRKDLYSVLVEVDVTDEAEVARIHGLLTDAGLERDDHVPGNTVRIDKYGPARIFNMVYRRPGATG